MTDDMQFDGFDGWSTDPELEIGKGVDIGYGEGRFITIRRAGGRNVAFNQMVARTLPKKGRKLSPEADRATLHKIYADTIVVGWRGMKSGGKTIPFNKENLIKFFNTYPDVFEEICVRATALDDFLVDQSKGTSKN